MGRTAYHAHQEEGLTWEENNLFLMDFELFFSRAGVSPENKMGRGESSSLWVRRRFGAKLYDALLMERVSFCQNRRPTHSFSFPPLLPAFLSGTPSRPFRNALTPFSGLHCWFPLSAPGRQRAVTRPGGRWYRWPLVTGTLTKSLLSLLHCD